MAVKVTKNDKRKMNALNAITLREQREMLCDRLSFTAAESYKQLRANLFFALPDENKCRIVGVTSSIWGEGKSTTAVNLAYTLAETGKKTLLIDADMRLPSVAKKLAAVSRPGLSNLLAGMSTAAEAIHESTLIDNWQIMPAGDIPPNPSELLGSEQMEKMLQELSGLYDFIVVDLPPVDIVSDALAISHCVNGIIVVVRSGYTDRRSLNECMRQLSVLRSKLLGFVMTDVEEHHKEYGKYGKKYYGIKYGEGYGYGSATKKAGGSEGEKKSSTASRAGSRTQSTGAPSRSSESRPARTQAAPAAKAQAKPEVQEPTIKLPQDIFDKPDGSGAER